MLSEAAEEDYQNCERLLDHLSVQIVTLRVGLHNASDGFL
jgi:hypothetical protein